MSIVDNKKAFHDYFIEERFEAGLVLEGWEVKAIRAGRAQIKEAYVLLRGGGGFPIRFPLRPRPFSHLPAPRNRLSILFPPLLLTKNHTV